MNYLYSMTKLISYMLPGVFLIVVFSLLKAFVIPVHVTYELWFTYLNFFVWIVCIVVPCVIYYLRTPPGIDHRE